jgi:hypothetical protein
MSLLEWKKVTFIVAVIQKVAPREEDWVVFRQRTISSQESNRKFNEQDKEEVA